jgi:hypothetical protein
MRIEIYASNPTDLLTKIKRDIKSEKIKTWSLIPDSDGNEYLTHNPTQWFKKALLQPAVKANPTRLILTVNWFSNSAPTEYIKGLYVGRFTEELLEHYRADFSKLETFA